ncbi:GntR family transcriptional regulator [Arthrobacter sp. ZBG10]|jgi:DNA-binding GntR family transcriptional regulator|uniref:GntR family transcriptional regulator n=1 Tax=unclassified Arthrobacter TaxID=235627 RepID=UPI00067F983F|nr:GntR family transcriptional regulator [Arthrobacter sp. ZBG10]KNH18013.1 GntR family transcriptional regulator [Arthrobacter sp. ZBG10]
MGKVSGLAASGREKAYAHLREYVLTDPELQGRFLNEQELAAEIGVSRTPVREALLLLVSDGLVELIPQRGAYVPPVTGREISELMELRGVLESHAARLVIAEQCVPQQLMQETLDLQARVPENGQAADAREFIRLDTLFHQQLIDAAGNELISRTYSKLHVRQILVGVAALFRTGGRRQAVCAEHQDILDALVAGDAGLAQESIDHHLAVTRDLLLRS